MIENIKALDEKSVAAEQNKVHRFNELIDDPLSVQNFNLCVLYNINRSRNFKKQQIKVNLFHVFTTVRRST